MNPEQPEPQQVYLVELPYDVDDFNTRYYAESAFIKREHAKKWAKYKKGMVSFQPIPVYNKDICPPPDPEEEQKKAKQRALAKLTQEEIKLLGL